MGCCINKGKGDKRITKITSVNVGKAQQGLPALKKNYEIDEDESKFLAVSEFGRVVKATRKLDASSQVAIKILNKKKLGKEFDQIKDEVEILNKLDHPYIVNYFETYDGKKEVYLVMEFIDGQMLKDKIEVNTAERKYGERTAARYMEQILKAMVHCHSHDIIHRDL